MTELTATDLPTLSHCFPEKSEVNSARTVLTCSFLLSCKQHFATICQENTKCQVYTEYYWVTSARKNHTNPPNISLLSLTVQQAMYTHTHIQVQKKQIKELETNTEPPWYKLMTFLLF